MARSAQNRTARRSSKDVTVLWVAQYDYAPGHVLTEHEHLDFWQLILVLSGAGTVRLAGRDQPIASHQLYLMAPRVHHAIRAGRSPLRTIDVKFLIGSAELGRACRELPTLTEKSAPAVVRLAKELLDEALVARPYHRELCNLKLTELLLTFLRNASGEKSLAAVPPSGDTQVADPTVRRTLEFVHRTYRNEITSTDLARAAGLSYRQLGAHFQAALAMSPMHYVSSYRIDRAKDLLRFSDYELKQVARLVGFKTVHHFSRVFHETVELAPGRWRDEQVRKIGEGVTLSEGFVNTFQNTAR